MAAETDRAESVPAVLTRRHGHLIELSLNRPQTLNAIDSHLARALLGAITEVSSDRSCRCLLITGTGRGFCSGQSLDPKDPLPREVGDLVRSRYSPIVEALLGLACPVIAAVNGPAVGAGFSLALLADLRVASESAWFSCGFTRIGLVPDSGATYFLPRYLGESRAVALALTNSRLSTSEAQHLGLVAEVFPDETFHDLALEYGQRVAEGPTRSLVLARRAIARGLTASLPDQLELEAQYQQAASETADFEEGLRAFQEKREPRFSGT